MRIGEFARSQRELDERNRFIKRISFLRAIEKIAPDVLTTLYEQVGIPFQKLFPMESETIDGLEMYTILSFFDKAHPNYEYSMAEKEEEAQDFWIDQHDDYFILWDGIQGADTAHFPEIIPLREAILQWADSWNLNAGWVNDRAFWTLQEWSIDQWEEPDYWNIGGGLGGSVDINEKEELGFMLSEQLPRWTPFMKKQSSYLRELETRVRNDISQHPVLSLLLQGPLKSHLDPMVKLLINHVRRDYCQKLIEYYESKGFKRFNERIRENQHIEWTTRLRTQCRTQEEVVGTFERIAEETGRKVNSIKKAVKETLIHIGMPLQPTFQPQKGRPKDRKDSPDSERQRYWNLHG